MWDTIRGERAWPPLYQVSQDEKILYFDNKRCVPTPLNTYVVLEHHEELGHLGVDKLTTEMERFYPCGIDTPKLNR